MKAFSLFFLVVGIGYPLVFLDLRRLERKLLQNGIATKVKVISARNYSVNYNDMSTLADSRSGRTYILEFFDQKNKLRKVHYNGERYSTKEIEDGNLSEVGELWDIVYSPNNPKYFLVGIREDLQRKAKAREKWSNHFVITVSIVLIIIGVILLFL